MKILLIRTVADEEDCSKATYNTQGIGLATALSKLGHECGLVYYAAKGRERTEQINSSGKMLTVYHIEGKIICKNVLFNDSIWKICDQYDVIQTSEYEQIFSWMVYSRYPGKTVIYHGPYYSKFTKKHNFRCYAFDKLFLWRNSYREAPVIVKSYLAKKYILGKGYHNVEMLGVGLNPASLEQGKLEMTEELKHIINEKGDKKYLLYVGYISKRKNLLFILEILKRLVAEDKQYHLIVVGGKAANEYKYYQNCISFIERYKLGDYVTFMGVLTQRQVGLLFLHCDVYLLATKYDIFGMVYLEAMYYGVPIVTTLCGGSSLLIKDGVTGFIRVDNDINQWMIAIKQVCRNKEIAETIRINSSILIKEHYLWDKLAPKFIEFYQSRLHL